MKHESDLPKGEREFLQGCLLEGEDIIWTGRAVPRYFDSANRGLFIFGVLWLAFTLFVLTGLLTGGALENNGGGSGNAVFLAVFFSVFILVGLAFATAPLRLHRRMERTSYALTDRRAIVLMRKSRGGFRQLVYPMGGEVVKERVARPDGSGDLVFGYEVVYRRKNGGPVLRPVGFISVRDLHHVETLVAKVSQAQS